MWMEGNRRLAKAIRLDKVEDVETLAVIYFLLIRASVVGWGDAVLQPTAGREAL